MRMRILGTTVLAICLHFPGLTGCARAELRCRVSRPAAEMCTPHLSLESADLTLSGETFRLRGRYDACYHVEEVRLGGKVLRHPHEGGITFELLATETEQETQPPAAFPRTVGTLDLDETTREGFFYDTWAVIRGQGTDRRLPPARAVHCTGND